MVADHAIPVDERTDFVFYQPWMRRKIDQHTATNRESDIRVVPDDIPFGWVHEDYDTEHTPRDDYWEDN